MYNLYNLLLILYKFLFLSPQQPTSQPYPCVVTNKGNKFYSICQEDKIYSQQLVQVTCSTFGYFSTLDSAYHKIFINELRG